jgi:hypothetical protein
MAYGLRIINDASELLVDSSYVNPTFVQKLEFNTAPSAGEEYARTDLHPGYTRRFYSTPTVNIGTGNYIVLWSLPDSMVPGQPEKDVWYLFPTSVAQNNLQFDCSVFATTSTSSTSYTLPTAYIFAIDAPGVNALSSSGPALRMFNTAGVKTFDSNFVQLVPYSISDNFALPTNDTATNLYLPVPTNPAYLLPKTAVAFASQRTVSGINFTDYAVFDIAFKRRGQYIDSKTMRTVSETEQGNFAPGFAAYFAGTYTNLSIIAADADLYASPGGGTGGGTNPTYQLSSFLTPEEGQSIAVTLTTTGILNGATVPYTITGITQADLSVGTVSGNFTISSNTNTLEFRFARDSATENETMRISVNNGNTFLDIPITDVPAGNEILTLSPSTFSYNDRIVLTITGGTPNGSFEFANFAQGIDPVFYFNNRWKPEYASTIGTAYFDENGNFSNPPYTALGPTGSDLGGSTTATVNRTFWIFNTTTKNFRSFNYTINPEAAFFISGTDNTQGPLYVNEGTTGFFKVTTANIPNGTVVYPKLIGGTLSANDFTNTGAGGITIQNNVATFQITFTADTFTDGQTEYAELVVQYPNGTTKNSYGNIFVSDTSLDAASYSLTKTVPTGSTANEGTAAYFYLTTNQSANLYWVLEGTGITNDDIEAAGAYDSDGNYYSYGADRSGIINSTYYQLFILFKNDVRTEGNETLTVNIKTGSTTGQVVASAVVIIGDTSLYPAAGTPVGNPYCIGVNRYQNYHDGSGGQYSSVIEYNSVTCGYVPPASYSVSRSPTSVNEGGYIIFTIGLTSVPVGTNLWWDISGTGITANDVLYVYHDAQDGNGWFTPSGGSPLNNTFTTDGSTVYQVILYFRNDAQTEGTETGTFNLRTGYSGGTSVANTTFTINDTSTTPVYNESLTIVSDDNGNYIVPLNGYMTIAITGGAPNTGFTFAITNNLDPQPSSFPGVNSLDGSGSFYNYITGATAQGGQVIGDKRLWVKFNFNNNIRSARFNVVYDYGTLSGGQYCVGFTLTQNYNNGSGGVYSQTVETNSATCGYVQQYTPVRTRSSYTYYNFDFQGDTWGINGGRPGGAVTATIINGPYVGFALSGTFNSSGQYRQIIGDYGSLVVGNYTINFTFPGQDAYYTTAYRTLVATFSVQNASAGGGGVIP